jgi:anti-anti-sigma regulatory factor
VAEGDFVGIQALGMMREAVERVLEGGGTQPIVLDMSRVTKLEALNAGAVGFESLRIRDHGHSCVVLMHLTLSSYLLPVLCPLPTRAVVSGELQTGVLRIELPPADGELTQVGPTARGPRVEYESSEGEVLVRVRGRFDHPGEVAPVNEAIDRALETPSAVVTLDLCAIDAASAVNLSWLAVAVLRIREAGRRCTVLVPRAMAGHLVPRLGVVAPAPIVSPEFQAECVRVDLQPATDQTES